MRIEKATHEQMGVFQEWALREGWQPGLRDVDAFYATDPGGFYIGYDQDDRALAMVSLVRYSPTYAFLGYYIVAPDDRGRGLGWRIWDSAVGQMQGVTIGLDGVLAQEQMYEQSGFRTQYYTVRYAGEVGQLQRTLAPRLRLSAPETEATSDRLSIHQTASVEFESLVDFDSRHVPVPRPRFLQQWLAPDSPRRSLVATTDNTVVGLVTIRPALPDGFRIGPLFAHDAEIAARLLALSVAGLDPNHMCAVDVPTINRSATALVHDLGMAPGFTAARMYRGPAPVGPPSGVFGVTSLELG